MPHPVKHPSTLTLVPNAHRKRMHVADAFRAAPHRDVILAPPVAILSQWVEDMVVRTCLLEGKAAPVPVDAFELQQLWERALGEGFTYLAKGERTLAARQARSADRLLNHWTQGKGVPHLERRFRKARNHVHAALEAAHKLQPEGWLAQLIQRLPQPLPCPLPPAIRLEGFHELTLLEQSLLRALEHRGVRIEQVAERPVNPSGLRIRSYPTLEDELAAAAAWANEQLQLGREQIVVVVNDLESHAEVVRGIFENLVTPHRRVALEDLPDAPFHVAAGEALIAQPVIADALLLLAISIGGLHRPAEFPQLSRWLLSPFWQGADDERVARARLEIKLRIDGQFWWRPLEVLRTARSASPAGSLAKLVAGIESVQSLTSGPKRDKSPAQRLFGILQGWGWPGPLACGSDVHRSVNQFNGLIERLGSLPLDSDAAALATLQQLCSESRIELRGGPLSPIQVLGPDDAAGLSFDAAWVANLHDGNWPDAPISNPFLPDHAASFIPRSSAESQLEYCRRITDKLSALASEVTFSWSRHSGEAPNGPSPLLPQVESLDMDAAPPSALSRIIAPEVTRLAGYRAHPWLIAVEDTEGLPLRAAIEAQPAQPIPGGSGMVRDQSACPMMAYALHRLKARIEDAPAPFADPAFRGTLMHGALQALYSAHAGRPGVPRPDGIEQAVEQALIDNRASRRLLPVSLDAERMRLRKLLAEWLDYESARPPFTVELLEETIRTDLLGHPISVRADRVDLMADGSRLVIDYKSSKGGTSGWAHDRLRQAQLPLYAVLLARDAEIPVGGIALATVRGGECRMDGVVANPESAFGAVYSFGNSRTSVTSRFPGWPQLLSHWQECIGQLVGEIVAGSAHNRVYDPTVLKWGDLELFLRHAEGSAWLLERGEEHVAAG